MRRLQFVFTHCYPLIGLQSGIWEQRKISETCCKQDGVTEGSVNSKTLINKEKTSLTSHSLKEEESHVAENFNTSKTSSSPDSSKQKKVSPKNEVHRETRSNFDYIHDQKNHNISTTNPFLHKLSQIEKSSAAFNAEETNKRDLRKQAHEKKILEERKRMLVFRDVGMDLDKPILSRDVFLVFKYFRHGIEFAVDNELERMLRYFNEHALNELKIIQNSKLMRGPSLLYRKRSHGKSLVSPFPLITSFPSIRGANMRQYCFFSQDTEQKAISILPFEGTRHFCEPFMKTKEVASSSSSRVFDEKDSSQTVLLTPSSFRRPTVLIYSQLGQRLGAEADTEWRRLAYASIFPPMLKFISRVDDKIKGPVESQLKSRSGGFRKRSPELPGVRSMPIDVVSLRSMDVYKYRWVHRLYVRRFAQSLMQPAKTSESVSDAQVRGLLTASSTFVGCKLLEPFYSVLGLRNYLSPYVMLIDHEGVIRWLSSGCPDDYEREHFPLLLKQLENEYFLAGGR